MRSTVLVGGLLLLPVACTGVERHFPDLPPVSSSGGFPGSSGSGGATSSSGSGGSSTSNPGTGGQSNNSGGSSGSNNSGGSSNPGTGGSTTGSGGNSTNTDAAPSSGSGGSSTASGGAGGSSPPPPPASGNTIEIDGKQLPSDKVIAFIYVGTSNLAGRAQEPNDMKDYFIWYGKSLPGGLPDPKADPTPLPYHPKLWMFTLDQKFVPAREPSASDHSVDQGAGPGMAIMRAAAAKWGPDYTFISIGRGQSGERGGYCAHFVERNLITNQPWSTVPPKTNEDAEANKTYGFYNEVITQRALKLKGKVTFGGIITMFGATEERPGAPVPSPPAEPYLSQCLIKIGQTYREALGDPNIPVIFGDFDHGSMDYTYDGVLGQKVRRQIVMAKAATPKSDIIPTDGIEMRDEHHFTMKGHKTWGDRAIDLIDKNGWAPWAKK